MDIPDSEEIDVDNFTVTGEAVYNWQTLAKEAEQIDVVNFVVAGAFGSLQLVDNQPSHLPSNFEAVVPRLDDDIVEDRKCKDCL